MRQILYVLLLLCLPLAGYSDHVFGGELTMRYLGKGGNYRIQLNQFVDGAHVNASNRDYSATVYIFRKKNPILMDSFILNFRKRESISYENAACAKAQNLSTFNDTFDTDVQLNVGEYNDPDGYTLVFERCCRDKAITNVSKSTDVGLVFYLEFPPLVRGGVAVVNSSPVFSTPGGNYLCLNKLFTTAYSATDADGDELRYSLVTPYQGYTDATFVYGTGTPRSSYPFITWSPGFGPTNAIPGSPALQVDAKTGQLTVKPSMTGYFLFAVQCDEYRAGQKIGTIRRDFLLSVVDCPINTPPAPVITLNGKPAQTGTICAGASLSLAADASPLWAYQWQQDGVNLAGETAPSLTVANPGRYTVVRRSVVNCASEIASSPVQVQTAPLPAVAADSITPVCVGSSGIPLRGTPATGVWSGKGVIGSRFDPTAAGEGVQPVRYTVTDGNGCQNSVVRWVHVTPPLRLDGALTHRVQRNDAVRLQLQPSMANASVRWSPALYLDDPAIPAPLYRSGESTTYTVQAQTASGCQATARVAVQVFERLYIPTAFSPNGDGENEQWRPINSESFPDCEVSVYNRWGNLVYQGTGSNAVWDGRYQQEVVEPGVYLYQIKTGPNEPLLSGTLTVFR
ncbi:gliding motility-associated C-terminal domain-containing protein [Fibrella sp. HMF5335]|uniref:Gliding motility-associated C-terminal domain-containing protein n=1 Tax=Fibrella rubiginis TaxID=2817060 RepID=A0A939GCW2_9BACT|nr:gliding motility-associated C-terminal domain-containing protein [Fibrella rubiginis]MBO0935210.1 gliding motility-associated C-terminal domain-containing protein [Fibrella rubiginis]